MGRLPLVVAFVLLPLFSFAQDNFDHALADLVVNGSRHGTIPFMSGPEGELLISTVALASSLDGILKPEFLASLESKDRLATPAELAAFGIRISFDAPNLVLSVSVAPESMKPEVLVAGEGTGPRAGGFRIRNAPISAVVGTSLEFDPSAQWETEGSFDWAGKLGVSPALSILGLVLEASSTFSFGPLGASVAVDSARAVYDFPSIGARLAAGIVGAGGDVFQSSLPIYGLSFGRQTGLPGWSPGADPVVGELTLEHPAKLRVFVNGGFVRELSLQPGTYRLGDLPLASGLNDVLVQVDERDAEPRLIRLGVPFDQTLVGKGKIDYSVALGTVRDDPMQPLGAARFAMGLGDLFQAGAGLEMGYGQGLLEASALAATPAGNFGLATALESGIDEISSLSPPRVAGRAYWRFSSFVGPFAPRLGAGIDYRDAGFVAPGATDAYPAPLLNLSAQVGSGLPGGIGLASLSGTATFAAGSLDGWSTTFGLGFSPARATLLSFSCGYAWKSASGGQPQANISLTVAPSDRRGLAYRRDFVSAIDTATLSFGAGDAGSLDIIGSNWGGGAPPSLDLAGSLGQSWGTVSSSLAIGADSGLGNRAATGSLGVATSLVVAEGVFALSRSGASSLAVLVPSAALRGHRVELRPDGGSPVASARGESVVASGLLPYKAFDASVEMPDSPPDQRPDPDRFELSPTYRSVAVVRVGLAYSETLHGILVGEGGAPRPGLIGDLRDAKGAAIPGSSTFTDEKGVFECYGLAPGSYTIVWSDASTSAIEAPRGEPGAIIDLGDVVATPSARQGSGP